MNPFFSIASVRRLQPMIDERVQTFLGRLNELKDTGEVVRMAVVVNAFSNAQFSQAPNKERERERERERETSTG